MNFANKFERFRHVINAGAKYIGFTFVWLTMITGIFLLPAIIWIESPLWIAAKIILSIPFAWIILWSIINVKVIYRTLMDL